MNEREAAEYIFEMPVGKLIREFKWAMEKVGLPELTPDQERNMRDILSDPQERSAFASMIAGMHVGTIK